MKPQEFAKLLNKQAQHYPSGKIRINIKALFRKRPWTKRELGSVPIRKKKA